MKEGLQKTKNRQKLESRRNFWLNFFVINYQYKAPIVINSNSENRRSFLVKNVKENIRRKELNWLGNTLGNLAFKSRDNHEFCCFRAFDLDCYAWLFDLRFSLFVFVFFPRKRNIP